MKKHICPGWPSRGRQDHGRTAWQPNGLGAAFVDCDSIIVPEDARCR